MKLIVNADDFGLTVNVSKAILKGMREGILTDTNAIVNTSDFKSSAEMALDFGIEEMGLHCLLTMGKPLLPANLIPSLVNEEGNFYKREDFKNQEINVLEAEMEIEAQIQVFLDSGLKLSHITTHHGFMNKSEEMTKLFIRLAKKYNVPLRNEAVRRKRFDLVELYKKEGIILCDYMYFNHGTPHHTVEDVKRIILEAIQKYETLEIGCHPGYSDDLLRKISPLNDDREKELEVILDQDLKKLIDTLNIQKISYSDLRRK